jgi:hypothetical protein
MANAKPKLSIHAAVMDCVSRCSESDSPYVCLGDFLDELIQIGWGREDVNSVGAAVLPMLGELKNGDTVRIGTAKPSVSSPLPAD